MIAVALAALSGCGPGAFAPAFQEREEPEFSRVLDQLSSAEVRDELPVVVVVTREGGLVAWDLRENRRLWSEAVEATTTPLVAGRYVVSAEAGGIVARRIEDGARTLALGDRELHLVGADGEGDALIVSLARGEGDSPPGMVVGANAGGARWAEELPLPVAFPALIGGVAIVPWAHQRVSFLDAEAGTERARLRLADAVVGHVLRHERRVLLGQHELFVLGPELAERGRRANDFVRPAGRPLPGQPPLLTDGYERRRSPDSAQNRVRLTWALGRGEGELAFSDGLIYFVFYRMVFGLEAGSDAVRWVSVLASDAVGIAADEGGVMVATEDGALRYLEASGGREVWTASVGAPIRAAEVRLAGFRPEASAGENEPLRVQLERAAALEDARLDAGRALAIRYLAAFEDEDVTGRLIALCAPRAILGPARRAACEALAGRTNGASHVRDALRGQASFLEDTPPPPVGALARAAANMRLRMVVPFLLRALEDPATPADELEGLFEGLGRLGDARAAAAIERFLRLYHADATDAREAEAIGAAALALLALVPDRFAVVQELSADPLAPEVVRGRLARALTDHRAAASTAAEPSPAPAPARPSAPVVDDRPERITNEIRLEVMRPIEARLRRCLERRDEDPHPSARISLFIDAEGRPQTVSVMPAALQECIEPLVRARTFPRTRRGSEALVHVIRR